jgi:hypothetical protein
MAMEEIKYRPFAASLKLEGTDAIFACFLHHAADLRTLAE